METEVIQRLVRIETKVDDIVTLLNKQNNRISETEDRIDKLESFRDKLVVVAAILGTLIGSGTIYGVVKWLLH